ncbi:hypothetical protein TNCV_4233301 [Trichonephila clavipes]|nr:hypothetical protein TNCV_4233301 [Trichonephila clavipes]
MTTVDFLHHENPPTWTGIELVTIGAEGQRQTNQATQPARGGNIIPEKCDNLIIPIRSKALQVDWLLLSCTKDSVKTTNDPITRRTLLEPVDVSECDVDGVTDPLRPHLRNPVSRFRMPLRKPADHFQFVLKAIWKSIDSLMTCCGQ